MLLITFSLFLRFKAMDKDQILISLCKGLLS